MMKPRIILPLMLTALAWVGMAADETEFNPANPPEPNDIYVYKHRVTVTADPAGKGYTSGTGKYAEGTMVTVSTSSAVANWVFKGWLKDGVADTEHTSASFRYTIGTTDVAFTALYEYEEPEDPGEPQEPEEPELPPFDPSNPNEPETPTFPDKPQPPEPPVVIPKYTLTLVSEPFEACSFNMGSGNSYTSGTNLTIRATGNQGFVFQGWYDADGEQLSETLSFGYTMPESNSTVTARWVFDPADDPGDPSSSQENVFNPVFGDVNADGEFTILDIVLAREFVMGRTPANGIKSAADINKDKEVTLVDIILIVDKIKASASE